MFVFFLFGWLFYLFIYFGMVAGVGNPGYKASISCMVSLTFLKSCINLHFADLFLIMKIEEFQGELDA